VKSFIANLSFSGILCGFLEYKVYLSDSELVFDLSRSSLGTNPVSLFFLTFLLTH